MVIPNCLQQPKVAEAEDQAEADFDFGLVQFCACLCSSIFDPYTCLFKENQLPKASSKWIVSISSHNILSITCVHSSDRVQVHYNVEFA